MNNGTVMRYVTEAVTVPRPDPTRPLITYVIHDRYRGTEIGAPRQPALVAAAAVMDGAKRGDK